VFICSTRRDTQSSMAARYLLGAIAKSSTEYDARDNAVDVLDPLASDRAT
jgi:hypothetical protein